MVESKDLMTIVASYPLFQGLEPAYLELISSCASNVRFEEGETIFNLGDKADSFYAIRHGRVAIELYVPQRGAVTIQTLGEGEFLNWSWLFEPYECQFDARCTSLVRALAFDAACLRGKIEEDHRLGYELMRRFARIMVERIRATRLQLLDIYGNPDSP